MKINDIGFVNPHDRLDWRWERVQQLVEDGKEPQKCEDRYIWKAFHFLRAYEDAETRCAVYELCLKNKAIAKAVGWNKEPGQRRYFIEALLLCRDLTDEGVADYLKEDLTAVIYYEKIFFDIGDNKYDTGCVAKHVFKPALLRKMHDTTDPDLGWKLSATFGGFELVRSYWELTIMPDSVQDMCTNTGISILKRNFCLGNFARPVNKYSTDKITEHLMRHFEIQVKKEIAEGMGGGGGGDDKLSLMSEVLDSIQFTMVEPGDMLPEQRQPRLSERLSSASGMPLQPYTGGN
jgi:hypothetical protein